MWRTASLLALLSACTPKAAPSECAARVAAMRALFAHGAGPPIAIYPAEGGRFPASSRGVAITDGLPVHLRRDGSFELSGAVHTAEGLAAALADEFDKARQLRENLGQPLTPIRLLIAADARAPLRALVELTGMVAPDTPLALIVDLAGDTVPTPPPIPPAVQAVLRDSAAQFRSQRIAELITPSLAGCPALGEVFEAVATTTSDTRAQVLLDRLPGALERCDCAGVDVDTLLAVTWTMSGKTEVEKRELPLPLSRDPNSEAVALAADATVEDLVPVLEARGARPFHVMQRQEPGA